MQLHHKHQNILGKIPLQLSVIFVEEGKNEDNVSTVSFWNLLLRTLQGDDVLSYDYIGLITVEVFKL